MCWLRCGSTELAAPSGAVRKLVSAEADRKEEPDAAATKKQELHALRAAWQKEQDEAAAARKAQRDAAQAAWRKEQQEAAAARKAELDAAEAAWQKTQQEAAAARKAKLAAAEAARQKERQAAAAVRKAELDQAELKAEQAVANALAEIHKYDSRQRGCRVSLALASCDTACLQQCGKLRTHSPSLSCC